MTPAELEHCVRSARDAALAAAVVLDEWRTKFTVKAKGRADLVTEADLAAQKTIQACLEKSCPGFAFLGEEGPARPLAPGDPPTWIVDPIDGTTNYIHDLPVYCISIGLWAEGDFVAGVIYDPRQNEMFHGAKGLGAWLGERRLQVRDTETLEDSLLAIGFPADLTGQAEQLRWWEAFTPLTRGLRRTGSSALNMAYVAAGRFDAFWALGNKIWDIAAGTVLVRDAGGFVTRFRDQSFDESGRELLCAGPPVHAAMQRVFQETSVARASG